MDYDNRVIMSGKFGAGLPSQLLTPEDCTADGVDNKKNYPFTPGKQNLWHV